MIRRLLARWGYRRVDERDYLEAMTGHGADWWVAFVQRRIGETWTPNPDDPDHPISDPRDWLHDVVDEVCAGMARVRTGPYDENIGAALVLSAVAGTWGSRCAHAKTQDPRRPVALRQDAYRRWLAHVGAIAQVLVDASSDPDFFDQPWETPFAPDATDGSFV